MSKAPQVLFVSHGGGPLPLLGDAAHQEMVDCLKQIAASLNKPSAILMISAHWDATTPTITAQANPPLIYDYQGFPEAAYQIEYPCPGEPVLAQAVFTALEKAGIRATLDEQRGLDHGTFVPLKIMFPEADIPCVQLSLVNNLDAETHIKLGHALRQMAYDNLLVIGSGFTFHNMRGFFGRDAGDTDSSNHAFEEWLIETCSDKSLTESERAKRLVDWKAAPKARDCHPREEHLLPLHVCYGVAQSACDASYALSILNKKVSMYLWRSV